MSAAWIPMPVLRQWRLTSENEGDKFEHDCMQDASILILRCTVVKVLWLRYSAEAQRWLFC